MPALRIQVFILGQALSFVFNAPIAHGAHQCRSLFTGPPPQSTAEGTGLAPAPHGTQPQAGPGRRLRPAQREGVLAGIETQRRGDRRYLYVAPTGTGKTQVVVETLNYRMQQDRRKLHIVTADRTLLTNQLAQNLRARLRSPHLIVEWGGAHGSQSFQQILHMAYRSDRPVVLVTTTQSLKARLQDEFPGGELSDAQARQVFTVLSSFTIDEAHHAGAEQTKDLISLLMDHPQSEVFLLGTTATPIHPDALIEEIFGRRAFWAYIDTVDTFLSRESSYERSLDTILDQLSRAIQAGDLTPFGNLHVIRPEALGAARGHLVVDQNSFDGIMRNLGPLLQRHHRGFFTLGSINESRNFAQYLERSGRVRGRVASLDSQNSGRETTREAFARGEIQFLTTVRMLDEGVDFPDLSLYVDLNRSVGVRSLLQRIGRVLRLHEGKKSVDIAMIADVNETSVREMLQFFERVERGDFAAPAADTQGQSRRGSTDISELGELILDLRSFWNRVELSSYEEHQQFARSRNVRSQAQWRELIRELGSDWPSHISKIPDRLFTGRGWSDWRAFLGTTRQFVTYGEASQFARSHHVRSQAQWTQLVRRLGDQWPAQIPKAPPELYSRTGEWRGWSEFLNSRQYASFEEHRQFALRHNVRSVSQWRALIDHLGDQWPQDIAKAPFQVFAGSEWKGWGHFTGSNRLATHNREYASLEEHRQFALRHNVRSVSQWRALIDRLGDQWPHDIAKKPDRVFANRGWPGWTAFWGGPSSR